MKTNSPLNNFLILRQRRSKTKHVFVASGICIAIIAIVMFTPIRGFLHSVLTSMVSVVWRGEENMGAALAAVDLRSRADILEENKTLHATLGSLAPLRTELSALRDENESLRRSVSMALAGQSRQVAEILTRPNRSPYDMITISKSPEQRFAQGDLVFADSDVILGVVESTTESTALVRLYSSPDTQVDVRIGTSSTPAMARGVGGQNMRIELPEGVRAAVGDFVSLSVPMHNVLGVVAGVDRTTRQALQTILVRSPINIYTARFVWVQPVVHIQ